ncbi:MAG: dehydratase [Aeromicrobium sp.]|jgi:itaconyl-CoA hydratase|nr:dehydratase [Aeromicrobium sp.]
MTNRPEPTLDDFPLWRRGPDIPGFAEGVELDHHWARTMTDAESALFASLTCSWSPLVLDVESARAAGHPGRVIHPYLVLCTVFGLSVEDLSESAGPFLSITDCHFERPMYDGDTVTARSTVINVRESSSRPGHRIVTWHTEAFNQRDERVLDYRRSNLMKVEA